MVGASNYKLKIQEFWYKYQAAQNSTNQAVVQAAAISLVSAKLDNQYQSDRGYYLHMDYNTFTSASKKRQPKQV